MTHLAALPVVSPTIYPVDCLKISVKNWEGLRFYLTCKLISEPATVSCMPAEHMRLPDQRQIILLLEAQK